MKPYYQHAGITLYNADCREILPQLHVVPHVLIADPPYQETSLAWDKDATGWTQVVAEMPGAFSLWCFGSMRLFLRIAQDLLTDWIFAQDLVWEKQNGTGFHADRFRRIHEHVLQFYRKTEQWSQIYHSPVKIPGARRKHVLRGQKPAHMRQIASAVYTSWEGGPRLMTSVIPVPNCHLYALNETQKPCGIVAPLIEYSSPPGGLVISPFAGSGTDLYVAKALGRKAIGIEIREDQCEITAKRLSQEVFPFPAEPPLCQQKESL